MIAKNFTVGQFLWKNITTIIVIFAWLRRVGLPTILCHASVHHTTLYIITAKPPGDSFSVSWWIFCFKGSIFLKNMVYFLRNQEQMFCISVVIE